MSQMHHRWARPTLVGLLFASGTLFLNSAVAGSPPSYEQMYEMIKGLQARVTTLEKQNEVYRAQLASVRTSTNTKSQPRPAVYYPGLMGDPILLAGAPEPSNGATNGTRDHAPATRIEPDPGWTGLYLGSSFGYGRSNAQSSFRQDYTESGYYRSNYPGSPYFVTTYDYSDTTSGQSGWDSGDVAAVDLFVGFNKQFASNLVAGVQLEGSLAHGDFNTVIPLTESASYKYKFGQENDRQYAEEGTYNSSPYPTSDIYTLNWMGSLLGRVGWLVTPKTLIYGLAGWTYGHFDHRGLTVPTATTAGGSPGIVRIANSTSSDSTSTTGSVEDFSNFGLHGVSLGAGVERKLGRNWTLRAEYRYTDFGDYDAFSSVTTNNSEFILNGPDGRPDLSGTAIGSGTATTQTSAGFDGDMQMFRIALTRYFGLSD